MNILTDTQIEFILTFFKNTSYHGWKEIATKLLKNDYCIVAGTINIWKGGVGNFVKVTPSDDFFGCVKYTFDLKSFLSSNYFKDVIESKLIDVKEEIENKKNEFNDLEALINN